MLSFKSYECGYINLGNSFEFMKYYKIYLTELNNSDWCIHQVTKIVHYPNRYNFENK